MSEELKVAGIVLKRGDETFIASIEEARGLFEQLKGLFEKEEPITPINPIPIIPWQPMSPSPPNLTPVTPYTPYWPENPGSGPWITYCFASPN